jgi:adenosyl cobinamide kinase/adenosyl cobinamide phosphate guanylyltransferase
MDAGWPAHEIEGAAGRTAARAARRPGQTIGVSNEVGSGIVPADANTRAYRDVLGWVNATWSTVADRAYLVVAGRLLPLLDPDGAFGG